MKKLVIILTSLLLLSGCSDAYAKVTDANTTMFTVGNTTVTKGDLYTSMINYGGSYTLMSDVTKTIFDIEVPVTDEIESDADDIVDMYQSWYGDSFESLLQQNGFDDIESYRTALITNLQAEELYKKYIEANYDTMAADQNPVKIILFEFESEDNANSALEELNNGGDPTEVAATYESSTDGTEELVLAGTSSYPSELLAAIAGAEKDTYTLVAGTDGTYFVFKVTENDLEALKDDVVSELASDDDIQTEAMKYYLDQYKFGIYDKTMNDAVMNDYPDYYSGQN